jgi:hypothetical protein
MTLEQQLATLQSERQSIQNVIEGLREKSLALFDQIQSIKDQIAEQKIQQSIKPDWEFLLKNDNGTVAYEELKQQLAKFGIGTGSYNPVTNQMVAQISLKSNDADGLKLVHAGLNEVIPYIIPKFGYKFIDIFEHTLSEDGSYSLHIYEKEHNQFKLMVTRWHRESVVYESDNLMDVLAYIQKHHHRDSPKEDYLDDSY